MDLAQRRKSAVNPEFDIRTSLGPERWQSLEDVGVSALLKAYFENKSTLTRFLAARLGDWHAAEDLTQELYIKIKHAKASEEVRDPVAYLFRMALNSARDHRRERARARKREAEWSDSRSTMSGADVISDTRSSEDGYAAKQKLAAVRAALDELSPQCRRAFVLHKFDGLSHEEIARRVGITRSTVEKHMRTALLHLVERLGRD